MHDSVCRHTVHYMGGAGLDSISFKSVPGKRKIWQSNTFEGYNLNNFEKCDTFVNSEAMKWTDKCKGLYCNFDKDRIDIQYRYFGIQKLLQIRTIEVLGLSPLPSFTPINNSIMPWVSK